MSGTPAAALLAVEGLEARYGRARILAGLHLTVAHGEVVVLLGRNGAGKSTTLKAIMGLVPPAAGRVRFEGHDLAGQPPFRIARAGLGYVPEDRRIFAGLTVRENLAVGRRPAPAGRPGWTEERLFALFPALAALRDRPAGRMSGGEQQMLAIARTLAGNPRLLLLDEPAEGLAPAVMERLAEAVRALRADGLGILLSEQNLRFAAAVGDRALILETGVIRWEGPISVLLQDEALRARYLAL